MKTCSSRREHEHNNTKKGLGKNYLSPCLLGVLEVLNDHLILLRWQTYKFRLLALTRVGAYRHPISIFIVTEEYYGMSTRFCFLWPS